MEIPALPSEGILKQLESNGMLNEALDMYAQSLLNAHANNSKLAASRCKEYTTLPPNSLALRHAGLRKVVYFLVFKQSVLHDATVETYFDVVSIFGQKNLHACTEYLQSAPRSIPLKLGRLLLYKSEFGSELSEQHFRSVVSIFFSVPRMAEAVITSDFEKEVAKNRPLAHCETDVLLELAAMYRIGGTLHALVTLFPQLNPIEVEAVVKKTKLSVEELTQIILDDPEFVQNTLYPSADQKKKSRKEKSKKEKPKYVDLDDHEREAREQRIREESRRNFSYEYTELEDIDPEPEEDDTGVASELSEADKKLAAQDQVLWAQWEQNRDIFSRENRKSPLRAQLKNKLGWTDEQIEGWARFTGRRGRNGQSELIPKGVREVESYAPSVKSHEEKPRESKKSGNNQTHSSSASGGKQNNKSHSKPSSSGKPNGKPNDNKSGGKPGSKSDGKQKSGKPEVKPSSKPESKPNTKSGGSVGGISGGKPSTGKSGGKSNTNSKNH